MVQSLEDDLYTSYYAALLRRNWRFVLTWTLVGGLVGVVLILFILPRQYRATTTILFETPSGSTLTLPSNMPGLQALASKFGLGQQPPSAALMTLAFATSQSVRLGIVERLGLVEKWNCAGIFDAEERLSKATTVLLTDKGTLVIQVLVKGSPRGILPSSEDDLAERTLARNIANEYVSLVREKLDSLVLTRAQRKASFLEGRTREARRELDRAREALREGQVETQFLAPSQTLPPEVSTLATYAQELALAEAAQVAAQDELRELNAQLSDEEQMVVSTVVNQRSSAADRLKESVAEATAQLANYHAKGYSDEAPECRALLATIETLERAYEQELEEGLRKQAETRAMNPVRMQLLQQISRLEGARAGAAARVGELRRVMAEARTRVEALPKAMERVGALTHDVQIKTQIYEAVTNAYELARAEAAESAPQFTVLDPAVIPPRKIAPSGMRTCAALALAGFLLGVLAAPAWERRRQQRCATATTEEA
ncbi:MAG: GNVR domain-containing protein [Candidatus Zipacnadales bacterium]